MSMLNEHLEHHITQQILANPDLSAQYIEVSADNGSVKLSGTVNSYRSKLEAQNTASASEFVKTVQNDLSVSPPDQSGNSNIKIASQVNQRLNTFGDLSPYSILVTCADASVSLSGYVRTEREKLRVCDVVKSVGGVAKINNFLIANPDQVLENSRHCTKVLDAINTEAGLTTDSIQLSIVNESARLSGQVDSLWKFEQAEITVRKFGVLKVLNEIVVNPSLK